MIARLLALLRGDPQADRVVPPTGFTAWLTLFTAAAMAFLAVSALALALAAGQLADRWAEELARTATVRVSAPVGEIEAQTQAALRVLQTTEGIATARLLSEEERRALLAPWLGPDAPLEHLPLPRLIEVVAADGFDPEGLRLRLRGEVPGAVFDDHTRWRAPLVAAASRLSALAVASVALIAAATAAMIVLAARAALAANAEVIGVLRLIGATDAYIARAFVRRFTLRTLAGAALGSALAALALALLPRVQPEGGFLTGLGFRGAGWLWPLLVPPFAALVAFAATRAAAFRMLRKTP